MIFEGKKTTPCHDIYATATTACQQYLVPANMLLEASIFFTLFPAPLA